MNIASHHALFAKTETKNTDTKGSNVESLKSEYPGIHRETTTGSDHSEADVDVPVLIALFNSTFEDFNTRLVLGDDEPIYLPAGGERPYHQIVFAHGFFSSALHEIAHWCIAGKQRRLQEDYGYWYCPDGRDEAQQRAFELVEVKPQAVEWGFSLACGKRFNVSTDNLNGVEPDRALFTARVRAQLATYIRDGFPPRAQLFIDVLRHHYKIAPLSNLAEQFVDKEVEVTDCV